MAGWTHNTPIDTPTRGPHIAALCVIFTSIALFLVCLRLYVRTTLVKAVGYDDWMIVIAWLGACGYSVCSVIQTKWGLGIDSLKDMPPENVLPFGKLQFIGGPFYVVGIWGFKMSLLFSYLRFFPDGRYRIGTIAVAVACTMAHIAFFLVFLFLCTPIEKQYDPSIPADVGHCIDGVAFYLTFSSLTIIFDVLIMFLPFPVIIASQIQRRKKVALLCLFVLGALVTGIQAIRIQTIKSLSNYLDSAPAIQWSVIEVCMGIVIACVPPLAPMVKYYAAKSRGSNGGSGGTGGGGGGGVGGGGPRKATPSRYALQSWGTRRSGMRPLGAGVDREEAFVTGSSLATTTTTIKAEDSTENILAQGRGEEAITQRTELISTTHDADDTWSETGNTR
ncbi:integral membrane protein [Colletotrichum caudatum]|nr:integral membrane protein [Colletotrichum caudatum]